MTKQIKQHLFEANGDQARLLCGEDIEAAWVRGDTFVPVKKVKSAIVGVLCNRCLRAAIDTNLLPECESVDRPETL